MRTEYNLDINPKPDSIALYPALNYLFSENPLRQAFEQYETQSGRYKNAYWLLTKSAVFFIGLSVMFAVSASLFAEEFPLLRAWGVYAGAIGLLGLGLEFLVIFGKLKERWLLNRFAAERVRSYVAQLYAYGSAATSAENFETIIDHYCQDCLVNLHAEINKGRAAFKKFLPQTGLSLPEPVANPSQEIFDQCREAYHNLRVNFQKNFVSGELEKLTHTNRVESTVADVSFILGAVLTVAGLLIVTIDLGALTDIVSKALVLFGAISFFISAILGLIGLGSVSKGLYGRYQNYLDHIQALGPVAADSPKEFVQRVKNMETEVLRELEIFCLQIDSVSIRV